MIGTRNPGYADGQRKPDEQTARRIRALFQADYESLNFSIEAIRVESAEATCDGDMDFVGASVPYSRFWHQGEYSYYSSTENDLDAVKELHESIKSVISSLGLSASNPGLKAAALQENSTLSQMAQGPCHFHHHGVDSRIDGISVCVTKYVLCNLVDLEDRSHCSGMSDSTRSISSSLIQRLFSKNSLCSCRRSESSGDCEQARVRAADRISTSSLWLQDMTVRAILLRRLWSPDVGLEEAAYRMSNHIAAGFVLLVIPRCDGTLSVETDSQPLFFVNKRHVIKDKLPPAPPAACYASLEVTRCAVNLQLTSFEHALSDLEQEGIKCSLCSSVAHVRLLRFVLIAQQVCMEDDIGCDLDLQARVNSEEGGRLDRAVVLTEDEEILKIIDTQQMNPILPSWHLRIFGRFPGVEKDKEDEGKEEGALSYFTAALTLSARAAHLVGSTLAF
eukprot:142737-Hanusia_phi.AAC.7